MVFGYTITPKSTIMVCVYVSFFFIAIFIAMVRSMEENERSQKKNKSWFCVSQSLGLITKLQLPLPHSVLLLSTHIKQVQQFPALWNTGQ